MSKQSVTVKYLKKVPPLKSKQANSQYKFDRLKKEGDAFEVEGNGVNYGSLRTQASKQGKIRRMVFQVSKTDTGAIVRLDKILSA